MFLATNLRRYLSLMEARGVPSASVLGGSGISPGQLLDDTLLVSSRQCQAVVDNMIRRTGEAGLGLTIGSSAQLPDLGIISHALMSSRTMREMVLIWIEYSTSLVGSLIRPVLDELEPDGAWSLTITEPAGTGQVNAFFVEDFFCAGVQIGRQIAGRPLIVRQIDLSYAAPAHADLYRRTFGCPVNFDAPQTRIVISDPHLGQTMRNNDDLFLEICVRHCQQVLRQTAARNPMVAKLRSTFLQQPGELPGMAQAARRLGLSVRTLRRRLEEEGTTYNELVDHFRRDLAIEYLRTGHMAPKEIAYILGFSSPSTFRRAFKVWTDRTIGEFLEGDRPQRQLQETPSKPLTPRAGIPGSAPRPPSARRDPPSRTSGRRA